LTYERRDINIQTIFPGARAVDFEKGRKPNDPLSIMPSFLMSKEMTVTMWNILHNNTAQTYNNE
jgi:hypothetical protein